MEGLTFDTAAALLGRRDSRKIANNTYLERRSERRIAIRLHNTDVATLTPEWIELNSGGWYTKTTWDRMSYTPARIASGTRKRGIVVLLAGEGWDSGGHPYFDGIRLTADATALLEDQPNAPRGIMGPVTTRSGWSGMTASESRQSRGRQFAALRNGDYETFYRERAALSGQTQTLEPISEHNGAKVYSISQDMIRQCPHYIFTPEHYRVDGSCRCNDASHREMSEWGYSWEDGRWN